MKIKLICFSALFIISSTCYAKPNYDANDLKKFQESNACRSCNLSNAYIYGDHRHADLVDANISDASFQGDNTMADFTNVIGTKAYISNGSDAKINNAILIDAQFSGNFTNADFSNAVLRGASFSHTNLYGAKITSQQLSDARSVCDAILPDGTKGKCT